MYNIIPDMLCHTIKERGVGPVALDAGLGQDVFNAIKRKVVLDDAPGTAYQVKRVVAPLNGVQQVQPLAAIRANDRAQPRALEGGIFRHVWGGKRHTFFMEAQLISSIKTLAKDVADMQQRLDAQSKQLDDTIDILAAQTELLAAQHKRIDRLEVRIPGSNLAKVEELKAMMGEEAVAAVLHASQQRLEVPIPMSALAQVEAIKEMMGEEVVAAVLHAAQQGRMIGLEAPIPGSTIATLKVANAVMGEEAMAILLDQYQSP